MLKRYVQEPIQESLQVQSMELKGLVMDLFPQLLTNGNIVQTMLHGQPSQVQHLPHTILLL